MLAYDTSSKMRKLNLKTLALNVILAIHIWLILFIGLW